MKAIRVFAISLAVFVVLAAGLLFSVLKWPQWIIQDRHLPRIAHFLRVMEYVDLDWQRAHVEVSSESLLRKRIKLTMDGLCVRVSERLVVTCFKKAEAEALFSLAHLKPRFIELGPVKASGGGVWVNVRPSEKSENDANGDDGFEMPGVFQGTRFLPIDLSVERWVVQTPTTQVKGSARIGGFYDRRESHLYIDGHALLGDGTRVKINAQLDPKGAIEELKTAYRIQTQVRVGKSDLIVDAISTGMASPDRVSARVTGSAKGIPSEVGEIRVRDCEISIAREASELLPGSLQLNCPVSVQSPKLEGSLGRIELPEEFAALLQAQLRTGEYPPAPGARVEGGVSVELRPLKTSLFEGGGKVSAQVAGVPAEFPRQWTLDSDLGVEFKVPRFERLVQLLRGTRLDVWAPLRVLNGEVAVAATGKFDASSGVLPIRVQTRLSSAAQKVDVDAQGTLTLEGMKPNPRVSLKADVALTDVTLELPPLPPLPGAGNPTPDAFPRFFPDNRLKSDLSLHEQKKPGTEFSYEIHVHTVGDHPVFLKTDLVKTPVPVGVQLVLRDQDPSLTGSLRVMRFPFELFHREVQMDSFNLVFSPDGQGHELAGKILVPYSDYNITVLLLGTTRKPQVRFMSDPPLPEDQVLSVLLFGQKLDSLDPDESGTVGNTSAALREGAFSLISLYYLSSLNIQRIDYDPSTKTASLSYKLAEGTSLNLSQTGGSGTVGIRRRLSRSWSLTTSYGQPGDPTDRTASAFLEWTRQY